MSNLIKILERIASDSSLQSSKARKEFVSQLKISAEEKNLLIEGDIDQISTSLDVKKDIVCLIIPAEDDEPSKDDDDKEEGGESNQSSLVSNG